MIITYHGVECFRLQVGDFVVGVNPVSKRSSQGAVRFGADIALVSLNHPDFDGTDSLSYGDKQPFVIAGPGEYEVKNTFIKGYLTTTNYGGSGPKINTVYRIVLDGLRVVFLGALDSVELSSEIGEELREADVLFIPVGGGDVLSPDAAYNLSVTLEPKLVIPMHYGTDAVALKKFLSAAGAEKNGAESKLTIKKKDVEGKEGEIVVLNPVS